MLGQDKNMNEYWFFKDDPTRLFMKMSPTEENSAQWMFIDEDEKFEHLLESINIKGIREKKLQENLKKIRASLKMKKPKKQSAQKQEENADMKDDQNEESVPAEASDDNVDKVSEHSVKEDKSNKHHLFENDQYEQTIINAVWYNKTMPKKRKGEAWGLRTRGRGGQ